MHDFMKFYTGPPKFEFGRVEFALGGPGGPLVSKVNVEPWQYRENYPHMKCLANIFAKFSPSENNHVYSTFHQCCQTHVNFYFVQDEMLARVQYAVLYLVFITGAYALK